MATPDPTSFAVVVRRYRDRAGLTQEELAERARLSHRSISDIERGITRAPYKATIRRLADALNLGTDEREHFLALARGAAEEQTAPVPTATYLPAETSSLIGREREEAEALHLLRFETTRLLTLTGPGGVGKTRLALRLGQVMATDYDETCFISLAALSDPAFVPSAIAAGLGLTESSDQAAEQMIVARLSHGSTLLIVDNFEHLLPAAPLLSRLMSRCAGLRVLVTSRASLHLRDEYELAVPPLALPDAQRLPPLEALGRYPAVELFCRRARAVRPEFQLTAANAPTVADICIRLEGLPLALELAAARIRVLSPTELLLRLNRRLQLLTGGAIDLPPRQRAMRDTIAWSYDLLTTAVQSFFRRLAVFSGGALMEAIEQVVSVEGTLDLLTALEETSLIYTAETDSGETRYSMLETVREYALELLAADPAEETLRVRHAEFCLWLAKTSEKRLGDVEQSHWLTRMENEHNNVRAAIDWSVRTGRIALGLQIAYPMWRFWSLRGYLSEGRSHLERLLAACDDSVPPATQAAGLHAQAALAFSAANYSVAQDIWRRCVNVERAHGDGDSSILGAALNGLGGIATLRGHYVEAEDLFGEAEHLWRAEKDVSGLSVVLTNLGNISRYRGRYREALARYDEALEGYYTLGDPSNHLRLNMALVYQDLGEYERAIELLDQSIARSREAGNVLVELGSLASLAQIQVDVGNLENGRRLAHETAARCRLVGELSKLTSALNAEARAAVLLGDQDEALQLIQECMEVTRRADSQNLDPDVLLVSGFVHLQRGELEVAEQDSYRALEHARELEWWICVAEAQNQRAHIARLRAQYASAVQRHGEAAAIREALRIPLHRLYQSTYEGDLDMSLQALGRDAFTANWDEGWNRPQIASESETPERLAAASGHAGADASRRRSASSGRRQTRRTANEARH